MNKYFSIFKISLAQEFAYRLNFIMWRVRNVLQFFLVFFLWSTVFADPQRTVFDYNRASILTYIFGVLVIRAIVMSARTIDIAGEISRGELSNYLLKPINYFRYWFTRDISSKALNLGFAIGEFALLYYLLKPSFFFQTNILTILLFVLLLVLAIFIYFSLLFIVGMGTFWVPDQAWSAQFLLMTITEFLSGSIFPLDIFPHSVQKVFYMTPFPYLVFFPLQVYLGKIPLDQVWNGVLISIFWAAVLALSARALWNKGLRVYSAEGR